MPSFPSKHCVLAEMVDVSLTQGFLKRVNDFIKERRALGCGTMLPEANALLTLDEVLAVRLCACLHPSHVVPLRARRTHAPSMPTPCDSLDHT